jgi:hypothetical protein
VAARSLDWALEKSPEASACVFNLVLSGAHHRPLVNGLPCVSWGHGLQADPVCSHPFFGRMARVEASLRHLPGWATGTVSVSGAWRDRDRVVVGLF